MARFARSDTPVESGDHERLRARRRHELALGYRVFAALGWGDTGDGHITARDPQHLDSFWLLGYGVSFHEATVDDLVLVGPAGRGDDINPAAFNIHQPIHEARPDVVAAAHTHTPWGTPFAAERRLLEPVTQEACIFYDDHSLFDDEEVQVLGTDCGKRIAVALGANRAVILANHGLLTVGASVGEAVAGFVLMERAAEAQLKARAARPISGEAARRARTDLTGGAGLWQVFRWLVSRYVADLAAAGQGQVDERTS